jgi:hypothetical protein
MPLANLEELKVRKLSNTTKKKKMLAQRSPERKKTGRQQPMQGNVPKSAN